MAINYVAKTEINWGKKAMRVAASNKAIYTHSKKIKKKNLVFLSLSLSEIYLLALKSQICYKQFFFFLQLHLIQKQQQSALTS